MEVRFAAGALWDPVGFRKNRDDRVILPAGRRHNGQRSVKAVLPVFCLAEGVRELDVRRSAPNEHMFRLNINPRMQGGGFCGLLVRLFGFQNRLNRLLVSSLEKGGQPQRAQRTQRKREL